MYKLDDNPCYKVGALWKTRTKIKTQLFGCDDDEHFIIVPSNEIIMLLGYIIRETHDEHIHFLWNNKTLIARNVDVGLQFWIDPNGLNTQNTLLSKVQSKQSV